MIKKIYIPLAMVLLVVLCISVITSRLPDSQLEQIIARGELRMVTIYGPTTYMVDDDSKNGFEYELARLFARQLKLELSIIIAATKGEMIDILKEGKADFATGLFKNTYSEDPELVAGPEYDSVTQQVVYRNGSDRPQSAGDLYPFTLHVPEGIISEDALSQIKLQYPEFSWQIHYDEGSNELIDQIHNEQIAYALIYSNVLILAQQSYPELRAAFDISDPNPLIWMTRKSDDTSLLRQINQFFNTINGNGQLAELIEYYYGPLRKFDYVEQRRLVELYNSRLPDYEHLFRQSGDRYQLDWRLLAAIGYQESHWNEHARSPTGVRGMMMLTEDTATRMEVANRLDPAQSITGGAKYIRQLIDTLPQRIQQPDRTWLGLAAYNIGFAHLEDARIITQKRGGNPDKWLDVKESLPLLKDEQWYTQTTNGQARGGEAVAFVENIRRYYNTLIQLGHEPPVTKAL